MSRKESYISWLLNLHMTWKVTRCGSHSKAAGGSTCLAAWKYLPWFDYCNFTWDWCELHLQIQFMTQTQFVYLRHTPSNGISMQNRAQDRCNARLEITIPENMNVMISLLGCYFLTLAVPCVAFQAYAVI